MLLISTDENVTLSCVCVCVCVMLRVTCGKANTYNVEQLEQMREATVSQDATGGDGKENRDVEKGTFIVSRWEKNN